MPNNEPDESRQPAEWQLRILLELHKKQPRPTAGQKRLLATQTGLDAKWIAKWFKRINTTSKGKHQKVGSAPRGSQTAAATTATTTKSIDEIDSVKPVANLAEPALSGESPDLLTSSDALGHAFPFTSRSGIISDNVRSLVTCLRAGTHLPSWEPELEYPTVTPHDLQANREGPALYLRSQQGSHTGLHLSHMNLRLAANPQPPLAIVTTPVSYLTMPSFQHGDAPSPSSTGVEVQPASSPGPHSSPAAAGLLQTRYSHLSLASEPLSLAPAYTILEHPPGDLGPPATAHPHASVDLSAVVPNLVTPEPGQLPAVPSSAPVPSLYRFLFDMDDDSIDQPGDGNDVSSGSPPELPSGNAAGTGMMTATTLPHDSVNPTPVSFKAKWEDMLALERRIRSELSSSHENNDAATLLSQSKQVKVPEAQAQAQTRSQTQAEAQTRAPKPWKPPTEQSETDESLLTRP